MKKYDYLIVGAGFFGAVFANKATAAGKKCLVIDKRSHIGGNAYTEETADINIHKYGAHIFHTDKERVWDYVNQFAEFNNYVNTPLANYKGRLFNLPFNMNTFKQMWGIKTPEEAKEIIDNQRGEIVGEPKNLEEQAISLVGRDIYEALIKGYTEKQWGRKCSELPSFIIKRLPVRFEYNNNYFNHPYQGIPKGGYTKMFKKLLSGSDLILGCEFSEHPELKDEAEKIIYTGRIDEYFRCCFGALEYRTLRFENELLDIPEFQPTAVVNYTDETPAYTRIIEHKHFEFKEVERTIITKEYPAEFKVGDEPYYPVNDEKNQALYERYLELAKAENNVIFGGRLGSYKYYDMDCVIEAALSLAESEGL